MKRGWIAVLMIALSLICGGAEYFYVTSSADVYIAMLEDADKKMENSEVYEAGSVARRLDHRFGNQSGIFNIFMYHSEVGAISCDLSMLQRYAQTGDTEDFLATSAKARREIEAIKDELMFSWGNVL